MKKSVLLFIIICLLSSSMGISSPDAIDISKLLDQGKYDKLIRHLEKNFTQNEIIADQEMAYAYLKSLVFTGNIESAIAFYKVYAGSRSPDPETAYLYKISRIMEICGYYLKPKGLKKILVANGIEPRIRDSMTDIIDFYHISIQYKSNSPIFRNNINAVITNTIKNSKSRIALVKKCLDQENVDLLNIGLDCLHQEDVDRFKDKLIALVGIKGIHANDILHLLKFKYKTEVLDLAGSMLEDEHISDFIKGRVIIGLKGLPYSDTKDIIKTYMLSGDGKLKSSALILLGTYINSQEDALHVFISDLSAHYNPGLFSAYRKILHSMDLSGFKQLAASWNQFDGSIQEMISYSALNHKEKTRIVSRILDHADTLNHRLWYNILNKTVPPAEAGRHPEIIFLVSIDTLRRDHLNMYGYRRQTMPALAGILKKRGIIFDNVYANTSWTLPSHVSLLSGLSPVDHRVNEIHDTIEPSMPYFPEFLKDHGFFTVAFVTSALVSQQHRFERGFDFFYYHQEEKAGNIMEKVKIALHTLLNSGGDKPIFVFIHLYDCHSPYMPDDKFNIFRDSPPYRIPENDFINRQQNLYDGEIFYVDQILGNFIHKMQANWNAGFIITSDHGEEFLDHMGVHHGTTLYNEVVRVPFILLAAKEDIAGLNIKKNALFSIQDSPFILSRLLGLDYGAGDDNPRNQWVELLLHRGELHKIGLVKENTKVIYDISNNRFEAYHLVKDPSEKDSLDKAGFPGAVKYLKQRAEHLKQEEGGQGAIYPEDLEERLRELGYIH